jgi:two-component sensor histidine kinase
MRSLTLAMRLSRIPDKQDYLLAISFLAACLVVRFGIETIAPGIAYYVVMLPAVVFAGIFCGTGPAILAAFVGGAVIASLFQHHGLFDKSVGPAKFDTIVYALACAAVVWCTSQIRRFAADAVDARAKLQETLDSHDMVKNSLQLVSAFLQLQTNKVADGAAKSAIEAAMARVGAVADAHLALQSGRNLQTIECDQMLEALCRRTALLNSAISLECRANVGLWLDADLAIPISLIANELLTNALKHAFPPGVEGVVSLTATSEGGTLRMTVSDGGAGLPVSPIQPGLGSTVIASLARQIAATIETSSPAGGGTAVTLAMRLPAVLEVSNRAAHSMAG